MEARIVGPSLSPAERDMAVKSIAAGLENGSRTENTAAYADQHFTWLLSRKNAASGRAGSLATTAHITSNQANGPNGVLVICIGETDLQTEHYGLGGRQ
jgi:hypothetical protein